MSELTPEGRKRLVEDAMKRSKFKIATQEDADKIMARFQETASEVYRLSKVVYDQEHQNGFIHKQMLIQFVVKQWLDGLCKFDKDELLLIMTELLSKNMLDDMATDAADV